MNVQQTKAQSLYLVECLAEKLEIIQELFNKYTSASDSQHAKMFGNKRTKRRNPDKLRSSLLEDIFHNEFLPSTNDMLSILVKSNELSKEALTKPDEVIMKYESIDWAILKNLEKKRPIFKIIRPRKVQAPSTNSSKLTTKQQCIKELDISCNKVELSCFNDVKMEELFPANFVLRSPFQNKISLCFGTNKELTPIKFVGVYTPRRNFIRSTEGCFFKSESNAMKSDPSFDTVEDVSKYLCFKKIESRQDLNAAFIEPDTERFINEESLEEQIKSFLVQNKQLVE